MLGLPSSTASRISRSWKKAADSRPCRKTKTYSNDAYARSRHHRNPVEPDYLDRRRGGQGHHPHRILDAVERGQRLRLRADRRERAFGGAEQRQHPLVHRHIAGDGAAFPRRVRRRGHARRRCVHHQRPVARHRAPARCVRGQAGIPRGAPCRVCRGLLACSGHRRSSALGRAARGVRGRLPHAADAPPARRRGGCDLDQAVAHQCSHAGSDPGRHLGAGRRGRADGAAAAGDAGGIRAGRSARARRRDVHPLRGGDAGGDPRRCPRAPTIMPSTPTGWPSRSASSWR